MFFANTQISKYILAGLALSAALGASDTSAALVSAGNGLINDSALNITWLQDANLAASNTFGVAGIAPNGFMSWATALDWIAAMNTNNYLGYNDWRLPTTMDTGQAGCNFGYNGTDCGYNVDTNSSELAHLFYTELGNQSMRTTDGIEKPGVPGVDFGIVNAGPFLNLQNGNGDVGYWSGLYDYSPGEAWSFMVFSGEQGFYPQALDLLVWPVRTGQTAVVPVPAAAWLFGSWLGFVLLPFWKRLTR